MAKPDKKVIFQQLQNMQRIQLGQNGPEFSRIVAGVMTWGEWGKKLTAKKAANYIEECLSLGVSTFDHADIYGHYTTEALFGRATKGKSSLRQRMELISKCGIKLVTPNRPDYKLKSYDTSKAHILSSVDQSLKNLKTDYLDLLLIHRPSPLMDPSEIAETFNQLKQAGKVLNFGVSNFTITQFSTLNKYIPLVTNQIEISLLHDEFLLDGTLDQCLQHGIAPMAYSTMAKGAFFAKETSEQIKRIKKVVTKLKKKYRATYEELITAWLLSHPAKILPIIGTTVIERMATAVRATEINLEREDWFALWEASRGKEVA